MADTSAVRQFERSSLWATRLYFLLWFAGLGFVSPFLNLFYVNLGLSGTQIGAISAIASVVTLLAAPFWANRANRWQNPRAVLQLFVFFAGLTTLWLSQQTLFWAIVLVTLVQALFSAGIPALSDSLALRVSEVSQAGYGSIRVYGSLGWMLLVPFAGWIVERTELKNSLIGAGLLGLCAVVALFPIERRYFAARRESATSIRGVIHKLLQKPMLIGAGLMIVITGITGSGVYQFQGVYLGQLGASGTLIGIAGMLGSVVELPFMIWADRLAVKWGAYHLLLTAMLLFMAVRGAILLFPSVALIMVTEATAGIAYSFLTIGLVRFIAEQTDEHETRTVLALYTVTLTSLIGILSAPLAGFTFDHLGPRVLYLVAASGYLVAWIALYVTREVGRK